MKSKVKVAKATFMYSRTEFERQLLPELCMVGRSNVGKSSLINCLCEQRALARSSSTPGRTRLINYFEVQLQVGDDTNALQQKVVLVDLPGYGYSVASKQDKQKWDQMIEQYLTQSATLKLCLLLVDSRHTMQSDVDAMQYLYSKQIPFIVVATKADKLSKKQQTVALQNISQSLKIGKDNIIMTAVADKIGREILLQAIIDKLQNNYEILH